MATTDNPMTSDLRRVRYLGAAHSGVRGAWYMRLTSLALLPLSIACVFLVLSLVGRSYAEVHATLSHPLPALLLLLFILAGIAHMQLGMRTIIEDYVHGAHAKDCASPGICSSARRSAWPAPMPCWADKFCFGRFEPWRKR